MPTVKIKCPQTGKDVGTGIAMDLQTFSSSTLINNTVICPHCGQAHTWSKQDAFIE
jgi:endogenous inhibitor of DNA gyrase (YacG/DUF329 family)